MNYDAGESCSEIFHYITMTNFNFIPISHTQIEQRIKPQ